MKWEEIKKALKMEIAKVEKLEELIKSRIKELENDINEPRGLRDAKIKELKRLLG